MDKSFQMFSLIVILLVSIYVIDFKMTGDVTAEVGVNVACLVAISLPVNVADFGTIFQGGTDNTTDNLPPPMVVQNDGGSLVDVTIARANSSSPLFNGTGGGDNTTSFRFKARDPNATSFNDSTSITTFMNVPGTTPVTFVKQLRYASGHNAAFVDLLIAVPADEPPGAKSEMLDFIATQSEGLNCGEDPFVNKTATSTQLWLNGNRANLAITYPTQINATATTTALTVALYRNGTLIATGNPATNITTLAAGYYSYTATNAGNANYTGSNETWFVTVGKATPTLSLSVTPSTNVTNGTATNASCSASTSQVTPQLYRNGTPVSNPDVATLSVGTYNYTCNATATQNYTAPAATSSTLTVNQNATQAQCIQFNTTQADVLTISEESFGVQCTGLNLYVYVKNVCNSSVMVTQARVMWNSSAKIEVVNKDGTDRWSYSCSWGCSPTGRQSSGTLLDFGSRDWTISGGLTKQSQYTFDSSVEDDTFLIEFTMADGSIASSGNFTAS